MMRKTQTKQKTERQKKEIFMLFASVLCFGFVFSVFLFPFFVNAVNIGYTPLAPIPETTEAGKVTNLGSYLKGIYITGVALAGLFAVFSIVRGGFSLLFTDSIFGKMEGKGLILNAIGGLLVVFASYVFLNTLNPRLAKDLDLNLDFIERKIEPFQGEITLTTQQLKQLKEETDKARREKQAEIDELRKQYPNLEKDLKAALDRIDTEEIARLRAVERTIAQGELFLKGTSEERVATLSSLNSQTTAEARTNLDNALGAGGNIDKVRSAYADYRTALKDDPATVVESYFEEFSNVSVMQKSLAFGIIEHLPVEREKIGRASISIIDDTKLEKLEEQVSDRMQAIRGLQNEQRDNLKKALTAAKNNAELQSRILKDIERINAMAEEQICQIRNLCSIKKYSCKNLESNSKNCTISN